MPCEYISEDPSLKTSLKSSWHTPRHAGGKTINVPIPTGRVARPSTSASQEFCECGETNRLFSVFPVLFRNQKFARLCGIACCGSTQTSRTAGRTAVRSSFVKVRMFSSSNRVEPIQVVLLLSLSGLRNFTPI
jgi:hypothetical protein